MSQDATKPTAEPETLDLRSHDIVTHKVEELLRLFPEIRTEGDKVDFDKLRLALGQAVDTGKERFGMSWPGKADCFKTIQSPSVGTLRPQPLQSVNFDTSGNLMLDGDNLEVLKLLQKSYLGAIKMIYIDPPYNTGNEFIYPDDYSESLHTYLQYTGQTDATGRRFGTNADSDGRFHSKWLNMMYPRLYLARNLLSESGLIFVSIDDHEVTHAHKLMDEIFGPENACATFVWNTEGNTDNQYAVKVNHEYVIAYYKNATFKEQAIGRVIDPNTREDSNLWKGIADNNVNKNSPANPPEIVELPAGFPCSEESLVYLKKTVDEDFFAITRGEKWISDAVKSRYGIEKLSGLPIKLDDLVVEKHRLTKSCRIYGGMANRNKLAEFIKNGCEPIKDDDGQPLRFYVNANAAVRYHRENDKPQNILSVLRNFGTTERTKGYLKQIGISYDYAKPLPLIEYLIQIGCEPEDGVVLDFFSGSGTTAEAVLNVNRKTNGGRKFICVQLPEPSDDPAFASLADIGKQRIRRVLKKHAEESEGKLPIETGVPADLGMRVFSLAESNFTVWDATLPHEAEGLATQLELHVEHIREGRTADDILHELLLKSGFPLTAPVEKTAIAEKAVYSIAGGAFLICLDRTLTFELIRAIADLKPQRVVLLDEGFAGNDQLKANAVQTFKTKGVTSFKTV